MLIPQDKIDDILDTARIVDVISDYMTLRKKGSNYLGTCPFHHERTPSFSVNPNKQIWKCFSCGKGGNVLQFLMEKESMSFPEAVMTLAKKYNIEIEVNAMSEEERRKSLLRESEFNILKLASAEFEYNLNNTPAALEYLGSRSIDEEIIRKFGIGFAGNGNSLSSGFLKKGYKSELLISTGLAGNGERGLYDYFRSRIIFPFFNLQGKVIGFTGRITDNDIKTAKYLNSPETNLFDKGSALFGLYQAKASIGHMNRCYLVEGQFDVLSFVNAGVENTIAGSGTALTPKQVILINKFTKNVTLIYDNDAAGQKATMKNIEALVSAGSIVRVVTLPDGKDPDDFAKSYNGDLRIYLANHETGFVDYLFSKLKSEDVAIMNESLNKILSVISSFPEQSLRDSYIKHLADISETTFDDLIRRTRNLKKNASQIEVTELPDGIYGVDEAKECLEQKDDAFLLSNNFELFTDYLSIEPVVYLKGIPSVSDIQSLRSLSKYIEIENPRIHITEKRECDYLLSKIGRASCRERVLSLV